MLEWGTGALPADATLSRSAAGRFLFTGAGSGPFLLPSTSTGSAVGVSGTPWDTGWFKQLEVADNAGYVKVGASGTATVGGLRLRNADAVAWRNAANTANLSLTANASNQLTFNGLVVVTQAALDALITRVATLEGQVATLNTRMAGHTHASGTVQNAGGTAILP